MGVAYNPKIVTDGLVLLLDAANSKSYPGTGNTWFDLSASKKNDTLNGATYSNGTINFDGISNSSYAYLTGVPNFSAITISAWYYSNISTSSALISHLPFILHFRGAGFYLRANDGTDSGYLGWNPLPVGNVWNMLTGTWDGATMKLYLNGVKQANELSFAGGANKLLRNNEAVTIGGYFNSSQPWTNGKLSTVNIYNRALSDLEIKQNFNAMRGRYGV